MMPAVDFFKTGSFRPGEVVVHASRFGVGKSKYYNAMTKKQEPTAEILARATVDDAMWYTVKCPKEVAAWIRTQPENQWYNHIDRQWTYYHTVFDIHEELYAYLKLSWGE